MCLKIRSLVKSDISTVAAITAQFMHNSWTQRVFEDCLKADYLGWVLEKQSVTKIIGFMVALVQDQECQLMNIGIAPDYQRQGYAAYILQELIEYLQGVGVKRISLEVRQSNSAAIGLYKQLGFSEVGVRKGYYPATPKREDGLILFLNI